MRVPPHAVPLAPPSNSTREHGAKLVTPATVEVTIDDPLVVVVVRTVVLL